MGLRWWLAPLRVLRVNTQVRQWCIKAVRGCFRTVGGSFGRTPAYRGARSAMRFCVKVRKLAISTLPRAVATNIAPERPCGAVSAY
jgi:hypothetical protein